MMTDRRYSVRGHTAGEVRKGTKSGLLTIGYTRVLAAYSTGDESAQGRRSGWIQRLGWTEGGVAHRPLDGGQRSGSTELWITFLRGRG